MHVILVNQKDEVLGEAEKIIAHQNNWLHRAFSVFVYRGDLDQDPEILIQKRAAHKYHSGGLWTNTCCSHPSPGEETKMAATSRLYNEMGIQTELTWRGSFLYQAALDQGLSEHELDHVFIGPAPDQGFILNSDEAAEARWITLSALADDYQKNASIYTAWFWPALKIAFPQVKKYAA